MINSAFNDWSEHPVITTLDSIAAPINDIQFPTVTVCLDQPPDNWAFLENVLNSLAFSCNQEDYLGNSEFKHCNETEELRHDFKFLVSSLSYIYQRLPYEFGGDVIPKDLFHSSYFKNHNTNINWLLFVIKDMTANRTISSFELRDMVVDTFSKDIGLSKINQMLGVDGNLYDYIVHNETCIFGEECRNVFLTKLIIEFTKTKQTFGSVVRNYAHLDTESFSSTKTFLDSKEKFKLDEYDDICSILNENDKRLHYYFTNLSKLVGFEDSELISSFDIPGIFGDSRNLDENSWPPFMPQTFLYSKCKEYYEGEGSNSVFTPGLSLSNLEISESCIYKWDTSLDIKSLGNCNYGTLTINGVYCSDECGYRGENYTWCNTATSWDYCHIQDNFTTYEGNFLE